MADTGPGAASTGQAAVLSCGHPESEAQLVHQVQGKLTAWCLSCSARVEAESHGG